MTCLSKRAGLVCNGKAVLAKRAAWEKQNLVKASSFSDGDQCNDGQSINKKEKMWCSWFNLVCEVGSKSRASINWKPTREGAENILKYIENIFSEKGTLRGWKFVWRSWKQSWLDQFHLGTRQPSIVASLSSPTRIPSIKKPIRRCNSASSPVLDSRLVVSCPMN